MWLDHVRGNLSRASRLAPCPNDWSCLVRVTPVKPKKSSANPPPPSPTRSILQVTCTVIRSSACALLPLMELEDLFIILHLFFEKNSSNSQWFRMSFLPISPRCENFGCIRWNHASTSLCACITMLPQYGSSLLSIPVHLCLPWTYRWNRNQVNCTLTELTHWHSWYLLSFEDNFKKFMKTCVDFLIRSPSLTSLTK